MKIGAQKLKVVGGCRPMGPSSFPASQRFQEFRNIEKKMPETVGPGTYEVAKADD